MNKTTPEREIEKYLREKIKEIGGRAIKMVPAFESGIPDRQILYQGRTVFVELKKAGKNPSAIQAVFMRELEKMGFETRVIDSKEKVNQLISFLTNENTEPTIQTPDARG